MPKNGKEHQGGLDHEEAFSSAAACWHDGADHGAEERPDIRSDQLPHTGCRFLPVGLHRAESSLENIGCQNGEGRAAPEWMQEGHEKSIDRYFMQPMRNDSESA